MSIEPRHSRQSVLQRLDEFVESPACQTLARCIRQTSSGTVSQVFHSVNVVSRIDSPTTSVLPASEWGRALSVFSLDVCQHLHKFVIRLYLRELHKIDRYLKTWKRILKLPYLWRASQLAATSFAFSDDLLCAHIAKLQQLEAVWISQLGRLHICWLEMSAIDSFHADGHSFSHFITSIYMFICDKAAAPIAGTGDTISVLSGALASMPEFEEWCAQRSRPFAPPSFLRRHLPVILIGVGVGAVAARKVHLSRGEIDAWVTGRLDGLRQFALEHVVEPVRAIYCSIFDPTSSSHSSRQRLNESLDASQKALDGMLFDYGKKIGIKPEEVLLARSNDGDMTIVVDKFREEIQHPIKNTVSGTLVQALLIQMQKAKVDGEEIVLRLDQILKANEVNFQLLALIPSVVSIFILAGATRRLSSYWFWNALSKGRRESKKRFSRVLKHLDFFLVTGVDPRHEDEVLQAYTREKHLEGKEEKEVDKAEKEKQTGLLLLFLDELVPLAEKMGEDRPLLLADLRFLGLDVPKQQKLLVLQSMDRRYKWLYN